MGIPAALALAWLINANAGYILLITMVGQYLIYETFRFCCHVHENWFVQNASSASATMAHHSWGIMMDINMNDLPIADWLMGWYLKRGLLGHVFNSYDETRKPGSGRRSKNTLKPLAAAALNPVGARLAVS
jgi:hypothetical protein